MGHLDYKNFTQRHRPHIHPIGAVLFLTYRLAGTVPKETLRFYRAKGDWLRNEVARITATLGDADEHLAKQQLDRLDQFEREWFLKFEDILHKSQFGPSWLKEDQIAQTVADGLQELDGEAYRLDAYSIMSNHVHAVFKPLLADGELLETYDPNGRLVLTSDHPSLARIMQSLKGRSARVCNQLLGREGQFWQHENFDRVIRADKFDSTIRYVLNNPVKAGLVDHWRDWRWNYLRNELLTRF
ncbi:MAG TPA: transposase [Pyrinomonadaceae bacterium]|nr:transposase [Pyrinomonadaceae bacterium]